MNIGASGKILATATAQLSREWAETRARWPDIKGHDFERKYLVELQTKVDQAGIVLEKLEQIVKQVRAECE